MHKPPVVADQVSRHNIMDKTLKDYIDRTMKQLKKEEKTVEQSQDQYPVLPEDDGADTPKNPYGNH
jgi:hypothetical protein